MPNSLSNIYPELALALRERLKVIANQTLRIENPEAHLQQLKEASIRIMTLQAQLPKETPPQLMHFLERCSYEKALVYLEQGN